MSKDQEWVSVVAPGSRRQNRTSLNEWYKVPEVSNKKGKPESNGKTVDDWYVVPESYAVGHAGIKNKQSSSLKTFQSKVTPSFRTIGNLASTVNRNVSSSVTKASNGMMTTWRSHLYPRVESVRVARLIAADRKEMKKTPGITVAQFLEKKYGKDAVPRLEQGRSL